MKILFSREKPVDIDTFNKKFLNKYTGWGNTPTLKLTTTWSMTCCTLNYIINKPSSDPAMKYIISAPTGSAKTETMITYCSLLPQNITVLISTNLIDEAEKIAKSINRESNDSRAYAYHSKAEAKIDEITDVQIIVTTHAFYKNNYAGTSKWNMLGSNRDLIIIDEALETMQELTVVEDDITRAITLFSKLHKKQRFKNSPHFAKELQSLKNELITLQQSPTGTELIRSDKLWQLKNKA
jgi:hypothetical protein